MTDMAAVKRRFTYVKGDSRKFWEIQKPRHNADSDTWIVSVRFGRLGTSGQTHTKVYPSYKEWYAQKYYNTKISEKLSKGYLEEKPVAPKAVPKSYPHLLINKAPMVVPVEYGYDQSWAPPPKTHCTHDNLIRSGATWKCSACGYKVEFDKSTPKAEFEVVTKVRRYFGGGE